MRLIRPMLATLVPKAFDRPGWVYGEKYDGDRIFAYRRQQRVRLVSRNLNEVTTEFSEIADAVRVLPTSVSQASHGQEPEGVPPERT